MLRRNLVLFAARVAPLLPAEVAAGHPNIVLRNVFSAPAESIAIVEESSEDVDSLPRNHTYAQLRCDITSLASRMAAMDRGSATEGTVNSEPEDGSSNGIIVGAPSYHFVVALLACWYCRLMAVPTCHQHSLTHEMAWVFENSQARWVLYDEPTLKDLCGKAKINGGDSVNFV